MASSDAPEEKTPTIYTQCRVSILGWDNDDTAEATDFAERIASLTREFSKFFDLSRLEAVEIATDYPKALSQWKIGSTGKSFAPTSNEYGQGGAMTVPVIRGEELWSAIVIWTPLVRGLVDVNDEHHKQSLHTFLHELVHVDDRSFFDRTFPGGWRAAAAGSTRDHALQSIVQRCWSEYSASRRSAFAHPEFGMEYLGMLEQALTNVRDEIVSARHAYRIDGDMDTFWPLVEERVGFLFQALGYALGHADWILVAENVEPDLRKNVQMKLDKISTLSLGWMLDDARTATVPIFDLAEWSTLAICEPLAAVAAKLLHQFGIVLEARDHGFYVNVPIRSMSEF